MLATISSTYVVEAPSMHKAVKVAVKRARLIHGVSKDAVVEVVVERRHDELFAVTVVMSFAEV